MGRLIKEITSDGSEKLYIYDAANNRKSLIIKVDGDIYTHTTYSYDKMNRLTQVSENGELVATYTYDTNGNRESINYSNGNTTEYTYNLANNLKRLTNRLGAEVLSQYTYTYLLDGNQETKTDHNGKITTYTYDDLGRLISEAPDNEPSITYTYDDYNNRRAMTIEGISETTYEYDKSNRLKVERKIAGDITEITRYSYDHNGNQIYKGTEVIKPDMGETPSVNILVAGVDGGSSIVTFNQYNGFNQLIKTIVGDKTINYSYNGKGLRSSKEVNGAATIHIWDGDQIALEINGGGGVTNKYVRGINLLYAEDGEEKSFYLFNGHGDVVQLSSTLGNIVKEYDYDAFGNEKNPDPNDTNVFRYSGEYFDKETGTIYLRARYYNPYIGRFISEDTYKGTINDPLSLNYYIYCAGNPINYIDPSGHKREGVTERRPHERSRQTNAYQPVGKGMSFNITVGGAEVGVEVIWYNADAFDVKNLPTYRYNEKDYKFNFDEPVVYIYSGVDLGNDLGKVIANSLEGMKNIKKGTNWAASANGYLVHVMGHKVNFKSPVDYTGPFNYGTVTAKHISGTLAFDNMAKVYTMGVGISKSPVGFGFGRNYYYLLPQHLTIEFTEKLFQLLETIEEP